MEMPIGCSISAANLGGRWVIEKRLGFNLPHLRGTLPTAMSGSV
jgi:hypothetical protein